jgi:hypothetical protein
MFQHSFTAEFGIMSVAVLTELLNTLVAKDIISPVDVRDMLHRAIQEISGFRTEPTMRTASLIEDELLPLFSERSGR